MRGSELANIFPLKGEKPCVLQDFFETQQQSWVLQEGSRSNQPCSVLFLHHVKRFERERVM